MAFSKEDYLSRLQKATVTITNLSARLEALQRARTEPIAVVGIGCRFPGGADSLDSFWQLLTRGTDAVTEVPAARLWFPAGAGKHTDDRQKALRWAAFLKDVQHFDADFFGISAREAQSLDPQQRLLLEVAWEALEHGGYVPERLQGSRTGVFVGVTLSEYDDLCAARAPDRQDLYDLTGNLACFSAGRISYTLGLQGPSMSVDTACSSSLVAIHLACQSLRQGESSLALAGGVNLILSSRSGWLLSRSGALSPDGQCRAFDAQANGFVRGEGCGLLVLKRMADAQADGDRILALIRGSAVNQDGHSAGLTAPNVLAQQALLRQALENAGVTAAEIGYLETHGTGTSLGDPIEAEALLAVLGQPRADGSVCALGALKTVVGHMEAAAGVGGVIKAVLAMQHEEIPANLNFKTLNPRISLQGTPLVIPTGRLPWKTGGRPRYAGVSSFGMSGTNAHIVLQEAPPPPPPAAAPARAIELAVLSAKSEPALHAQAAQLHAHLQAHPELSLYEVAQSLGATRSALAHRLALPVTSRADLQAALAVAAQGQTPPGAACGTLAPTRGKLAFLFTGQGAQGVGMGRGLYAQWPAFRSAFDRCAELFARELAHPLAEVIWAAPGTVQAALLDQTEYTQPALFALEYALYALWRSFGVTPDYLAGHSIGELVAACVAGVFSLADAARLCAARGRLMQGLPAGGAMVAIAASEALVAAEVAAIGARVAVAAVNGPEHVVIGGEAAAVGAIAAGFARRSVRTTPLKVSHAFHSPLMEPMLEAFRRVAETVRYQPPALPLLSNLDGRLGKDEVCTAEYWVRHVREAVRFADGIRVLHAAGVSIFTEIGPSGTLLGLVPACLPGQPLDLVASLRPGRDDAHSMVAALGVLWTRGRSIDWAGLFPAPGRRVPLPTYPWQRQRYWVDAQPGGAGPRGLAKDLSAPEGGSAEQVAAELADSLRLTREEQQLATRLVTVLRDKAEQRQTWQLTREQSYSLRWHRQPLPQRTQGSDAGTWLVLMDEQGLGEPLSRALEEKGATCLRLHRPPLRPSPESAGGGTRGDSAAAISAILAQRQAESRAVSGVVDLWSAVGAGSEPGSPAEVCEGILLSALHGVRALAAQPGGAPTRLWLVTRGAVSIGPGDAVPAPAPAALWGLGQALALEHPELWGGLIDLPSAGAEDVLPALVSQLLAGDGEDQLALRRTGRHVLRLQRHPSVPPEPMGWKTDGTALVTGGLGALGLQVAHFLVQHGARHLVLTSRRGTAAPGAAAAIESLEQKGAGVTVAAVDVSDAAAVQRLLAEIDASLPPLRTIVHAAGLATPAKLAAIDAAHLKEVLAPKVIGALVLEELTRSRTLDALVCFSSVAAVWGEPGLGAYAAANAFMNALAQSAAATRRLVSVAWGPWAGGGMASAETIERLAERGLKPLSPQVALSALELALGQTASPLIIADVSWSQFRAVYEARSRRRLFSDLEEPAAAGPSEPVVPFTHHLAGLTPAARQEEVRQCVRAEVAAVLGMPPTTVPGSLPLRELGLDSLMAVELRTRLSGRLGATLPATLAYDYPTVEQLSEYLVGTLRSEPAVAPPAPAARPGPPDPAIAIIGMSCRFPGGVQTPEALWELLKSGRDAITEVPAERWELDGLYDPDPERSGKVYSRWGGFVAGVDQFDAGFFNIAPREAESLDPQQRLLLEVSWEALERAGLAPDRLQGSNSGIFIGISGSDYGLRIFQAGNMQRLDAYAGTGNLASVAAGRLAYWLGWLGPTMAIDTACSSSLVAVHLACQSLRNQECELALAGGVNLQLSPQTTITLSRMRALSPQGRCKTFDAAADGYVRSDGCGVLVLKRLADAQRDGDRPLAVIRGSAVSQGGRSNGLTAPSGPSQQAVIRRALAQAGIPPAQVSYVEAHGTGTMLGDPIELQALGAVLKEGRAAARPVVVGALKTNLGHAEAAAGVAGLIKTVLMLQHGAIPANLHFQTPSPHIPWSELPVRIPTELTPWPQEAGPRVAGVSAFGISGTNAHVIVQECPSPAAPAVPLPERPLHLLPLSARNAEALRTLAGHYAELLSTLPDRSLGDVAFSAGSGRSPMEERLAVIAETEQEAQQQLRRFASGEPAAGGIHGCIDPGRGRKVAFLFTGQGSQYVGMGRDLFATQPVFRAALEACAAVLASVLPQPLLSVLYPKDGELSPIDETAYTQPALFAVEYALYELWRSWGVQPDVLIGHSVGEYVAACAAGVMPLAEGLRLVAERGRLMQERTPAGAMVSVHSPAAELEAVLQEHAGEIAIAAYNAPEQIVLSGPPEALAALSAKLAAQGTKVRPLAVSRAFHSSLMAPVLSAFEEAASRVPLRPPQLPLISNLTGGVVQQEVTRPEYWRRQLREPVRFAEGIRTLREMGVNIFVELGPQPALLPLAAKGDASSGGLYLPSLRRERSDWAVILESLGRLWAQGGRVDWAGFERPYGRRRVELPTYPWQRQRHWLPEDAAPADALAAEPAAGRLRLSGRAIEQPGDTLHFILPIAVSRQPYLADHRVFDHTVVAGAFYPAVLLAIATEHFSASAVTLSDVLFVHPLILTGSTELHVMLKPDKDRYGFTIATARREPQAAPRSWREHATGFLRLSAEAPPPHVELERLRERHETRWTLDKFFDYLTGLQISYGPQWRWIRELCSGDDSALSRLGCPSVGQDRESPLHPALLDNAFATLAGAVLGSAAEDAGVSRPPWMFKELRWYGAPRGTVWCHSRIRQKPRAGDETMTSDLILFEEEGRVLATVTELITKRAPAGVFLQQEEDEGARYELAWRPAELPAAKVPEARSRKYLVFVSAAPLGVEVGAQLKPAAQRVITVEAGERFESLSPDHYRIRPTELADYRALLQGLCEEEDSCLDVVHLWSLDCTAVSQTTTASLEADLALGTYSAMLLVQALAQGHGRASSKLWLITAGTQPVGADGVVSVSQAPLWGLGQAVQSEHPELDCRRVDLSAQPDPLELRALLAEICSGDQLQVALRGTLRYVPRLIRSPATVTAERDAAGLRQDGSYLITGGLSGLGLETAELLARHGAGHLVLVGRQPPDSGAQRRIEQLGALGATVAVAAADISDPAAVASLLSRFGGEWPALRGVVHSAALILDGTIANQTLERFRQGLAAKLLGAWNLHRLTQSCRLDFFVCYSSVAVLLGGAGQSSYCAANLFIDSLAHYRHRSGLPGMSINWGGFSQTGIAARRGINERNAGRGLASLSPQQGMQRLWELLRRPCPQIAIMNFDARAFLRSHPGPLYRQLLSELLEGEDLAWTGAAKLPQHGSAEIRAAAPQARPALLTRFVSGLLEDILRLPATRIDPAVPLLQLGMDSLMVLELRKRIEGELSIQVPASFLMSGTSVQELSRYLLEALPDQGVQEEFETLVL